MFDRGQYLAKLCDGEPICSAMQTRLRVVFSSLPHFFQCETIQVVGQDMQLMQ